MITLQPEEKLGRLKTTLHGVNRGPVDRNWYFDLRPWFKRWQVPTIRTHDAIYNAYDTVDLHYLFPNPDADPSRPENYRFALTDDLLRAMRDTGAAIYFRLGETIEHQPRMMWNRPERWKPEVLAQVCVNIVRHYNEGWADGFRWNIEYWEFWNEPNGPRNWTGTPEEFYALYSHVATAIKTHDPALKVGLAGFGSGFIEAVGEPWRAMVKKCAENGVPVDFLSWHKYLENWHELVASAKRVRDFLNEINLPQAESHLGEWSYRPFLRTGTGGISVFSARNLKRYDLMQKLGAAQRSGASAAVVFGCLAALQDMDVNLAQYYSADTYSLFGLFDAFGVPGKRGMAFDAYTEFFRYARPVERIRAESGIESVIALAAVTPSGSIKVGIANLAENTEVPLELKLPRGLEQWKVAKLRLLDDTHLMQEILPLAQTEEERACNRFVVPFRGPGVAMLELLPVSTPITHDEEERSAAGIPVASAMKGAEGDW